MVIVSKGKTMMNGDSVDIAIDIITFMGAINELKKNNHKAYKATELAMKELIIEEEPFTLEMIKEFAVNMTEIFS